MEGKSQKVLQGILYFPALCAHVSVGAMNVELTISGWWWVGGRHQWEREKTQRGKQPNNIPGYYITTFVSIIGKEKGSGCSCPRGSTVGSLRKYNHKFTSFCAEIHFLLFQLGACIALAKGKIIPKTVKKEEQKFRCHCGLKCPPPTERALDCVPTAFHIITHYCINLHSSLFACWFVSHLRAMTIAFLSLIPNR